MNIFAQKLKQIHWEGELMPKWVNDQKVTLTFIFGAIAGMAIAALIVKYFAQ